MPKNYNKPGSTDYRAETPAAHSPGGGEYDNPRGNPGAAGGGGYDNQRGSQGAAGGGGYSWSKARSGHSPGGGDYSWAKIGPGGGTDPKGDENAARGPMGEPMDQSMPEGRSDVPSIYNPVRNGEI